MKEDETLRYVPIAEVKNILKKIEKEREELTYEQRIALEHSQSFSKLNLTKTQELIKELGSLGFLEEKHVYKIADILPVNEDDVKAIFAKERTTIGGEEIKKIVNTVKKYYTL